MVQTFAYEPFKNVLMPTLTTTYSCGAQSKRYLDKNGFPTETVWVRPLKIVRVQPEDVIEHREVMLYRHHYGT